MEYRWKDCLTNQLTDRNKVEEIVLRERNWIINIYDNFVIYLASLDFIGRI